MHFLFSSTVPIAEFASLSLLTESTAMGDYMMAASPLSTTPHALVSLQELHEYLAHRQKMIRVEGNNNSELPPSSAEQIATDESKQSPNQVFRTEHYGIALHYTVVKEPEIIRKSFSVLMASEGNPNISRVDGVVIAVGISGLSWTNPCSALVSRINTRLQDFVSIMRRIGQGTPEECKVSYKAILSTLFLTEDEERRTKAMVDATQVTVELEAEQNEKFGIKTKRSFKRGGVSSDPLNATIESKSSADIARVLEKVSALLSITEKECHLRKYNRNKTIEVTGSGNRSRRRKSKGDDIFRDFDYISPAETKTATAENTTVSPATRKNTFLSRPQRDTASKKTNRSSSLLSALAPSRSSIISNRRNSNRPKSRQAAFNAFDVESDDDAKVNGSSIKFPGLDGNGRNGKKNEQPVSFASREDSMSEVSFSFSEVGTKRSLWTGMDSSSLEDLSTPRASPTVLRNESSEELEYTYTEDEIEQLEFTSENETHNSPEASRITEVDYISRIQVNVALNEDLTCTYKQGKISSCAVEGVVQIQVKSDASENTPFFLLIRDSSRHIRMIQENRRYADDMTEHLSEENEEDNSLDHKFTISVPSAQNYFPVMRYKCSPELRPVPIRVQTRVRIQQGFCRVALQISSNPANEDDLTDLTIIMSVPSEVRGESLSTHPPGGVWNAVKRSVIWCVAELGDGEKFQLQAQFELDEEKIKTAEAEKPKFPVLVRCQCMYAQLSGIELEVADIPDVFPAEVTMKLARRFRLMHRERS